MSDYSLSGTHVINRWLWNRLLAGLPADFVKYTTAGLPTNGIVPIIPSQQLPEFNDIAGGAPFMIYNYSIQPMPNLWEQQDKIGYVIYDDNEARLRRIHNLMVTLLGRFDWTAFDINKYISSDAVLREFDFKWLQVDSAPGPQPFESEGGRHAAVVMLTASYTRDSFGGNSTNMTGGLGMRT